MSDNTTEPFVPYRERPPLDKGDIITWRELEPGMLFEPGVSSPSRRRVRGTPRVVEDGYLIGSEDVESGDPKGGILGSDADVFKRTYDDQGRPVYVISYHRTRDAELTRAGVNVAYRAFCETGCCEWSSELVDHEDQGQEALAEHTAAVHPEATEPKGSVDQSLDPTD